MDKSLAPFDWLFWIFQRLRQQEKEKKTRHHLRSGGDQLTRMQACMHVCVCSVVCTCCPSVYAVRVTGRSVQWLPPTSQTPGERATLCKKRRPRKQRSVAKTGWRQLLDAFPVVHSKCPSNATPGTLRKERLSGRLSLRPPPVWGAPPFAPIYTFVTAFALR